MSLDFIEELPQLNRPNAILLVIDKISNYGHFILITHIFFSAFQIAQLLYLNIVYKLHG